MKYLPAIALFMLIGCNPFYHPGPTHWAYDVGRFHEDQIICNSSGAVIATMWKSDDRWGVYGANGSGYGDFETREQAAEKMREVIASPSMWAIGSDYMECK